MTVVVLKEGDVIVEVHVIVDQNLVIVVVQEEILVIVEVLVIVDQN